MQPLIKTRSLVQIRTHAQKVFKKIGFKKLETSSQEELREILKQSQEEYPTGLNSNPASSSSLLSQSLLDRRSPPLQSSQNAGTQEQQRISPVKSPQTIRQGNNTAQSDETSSMIRANTMSPSNLLSSQSRSASSYYNQSQKQNQLAYSADGTMNKTTSTNANSNNHSNNSNNNNASLRSMQSTGSSHDHQIQQQQYHAHHHASQQADQLQHHSQHHPSSPSANDYLHLFHGVSLSLSS